MLKKPATKNHTKANLLYKPLMRTTTTTKRSKPWNEQLWWKRPPKTKNKKTTFKELCFPDFSNSFNFCASVTIINLRILWEFRPILTVVRKTTLLMLSTWPHLKSDVYSKLCANRPAKLSCPSLTSSMKLLLSLVPKTRSVYVKPHSLRISVTWPIHSMTFKSVRQENSMNLKAKKNFLKSTKRVS